MMCENYDAELGPARLELRAVASSAKAKLARDRDAPPPLLILPLVWFFSLPRFPLFVNATRPDTPTCDKITLLP